MSAERMCDDVISFTQGSELLQKLVKAGLNSKIAQEVIASRGNKKAQAMMAAFNEVVVEASQIVVASVKPEHFKLITTVSLTVPADYVHETQLATFVSEHGEGKDKRLYHLNPDYKDKHFAKTTVKLTPGQKLEVDVYGIIGRVSSEDCLELIESKEGLKVGAQGLTLVYKQVKDKLPRDKWHISPDKKENLPVLSGRVPVPGLDCRSAGGFDLRLNSWAGDWHDYYCVLVFRDCAG